MRDAILDLDVPPACEAGVTANLAALAEHFQRVVEFEIPVGPCDLLLPARAEIASRKGAIGSAPDLRLGQGNDR